MPTTEMLSSFQILHAHWFGTQGTELQMSPEAAHSGQSSQLGF
jgi:hypothetical protein